MKTVQIAGHAGRVTDMERGIAVRHSRCFVSGTRHSCLFAVLESKRNPLRKQSRFRLGSWLGWKQTEDPQFSIVDTASNHTIISSELADVPPRTLDNLVPPAEGSGLTGTGVFAKATLKVGPITWRDHRIVVMDMRDFSKSLGQKIDGLLGMDFFSEFEVVVVDLKNHKLILEP